MQIGIQLMPPQSPMDGGIDAMCKLRRFGLAKAGVEEAAPTLGAIRWAYRRPQADPLTKEIAIEGYGRFMAALLPASISAADWSASNLSIWQRPGTNRLGLILTHLGSRRLHQNRRYRV